jgi:peroxiredoxin
MNHRKNVLCLILFVVLCAAMLPCIAQVPTDEKHVIQYSETDSGKRYVTVMSWEHKRELYIADGMSEAKADSIIAVDLADLASMDRTAGDDRIGVQAPPFKFDGWLNSEPLTLEDLKGKVVRVRWFTDTCPFCASSAPALRELYEEYSDKGLTIVGVYHPKAGRNDPMDVQRVQRVVKTREFKFPIGIDWDWRNGTLKEWWLTGPERPATSVTFILDKSGVIQFIHPGMEYHEDNGSEQHAMCANDMGRIRAVIGRLIDE